MRIEHIDIPDAVANALQEAVDAGDYPDTAAAIRAALESWEAARTAERERIDEARAMFERARNSGYSDKTFREIWDGAIEEFRRENA